MSEDHTPSPRGHALNHITHTGSFDPSVKIASFERRRPNLETNRGVATLALVYQAAEAISHRELHANETEARAQSLVKSAIEKLKLAEHRIQSTESARRATISETSVQIQEALNALRQARSRVEAAESRASAAEKHAQAAETGAGEAEAALRSIEDAIRTQLLGAKRAPAENLVVA